MADKQCFVYIIDQGKSMGSHDNGRKESNLDFGMRYIYDKMAVTMAAARKTWNVGVVGVRTDTSKNDLADQDDNYKNIAIQKSMGPLFLSEFRDIRDRVRVSTTNKGDVISSIVIAVQMIEDFAKKLKFQRKIVILTDARGFMDGDDLDEISKKLNQENIELVIVGVDFDDAEYGFKEEEKDPRKAENEKLLKRLVDSCDNATFANVAEAIETLAVPSVKQTRPFKGFAGQLTLGDPSKYETAMAIDVERYFRTHKAPAPSASSFVVRNNLAPEEASQMPSKDEDDEGMDGVEYGGGGLAAVKQQRTYKVIDLDTPGGKKDVEKDDLAKGYEYGRTAVHISESDENVTKLETKMQLTVIGFVPREKHERFFNMGDSCITIAQQTNSKARMGFSSFVHALHELETCVVARLVKKDGADPQVILMFPSIEPDLESLIDVPLPFAEDVRAYRFPPLDRVITVQGTVLSKHRNIPTDELQDAMSAYVDSMDISAFGKDEDGNPTEYMPIEETFSPSMHRINQAVRRRAIRPEEPVGPPAEILTKYSHPPEGLIKTSKTKLEKLIAAADIKKVPPKVKGKRTRDYNNKPLSGLDINALLSTSSQKRTKISPQNAIPEYKQALPSNNVTSPEEIHTLAKSATEQMMAITRDLITNSTGDSHYEQALANIQVMRSELLDLEEFGIYHDVIKALKTSLLKGELGGDRREFFALIRRHKLGLVTVAEDENSEVSEEDVREFYDVKASLPLR